MSDSGRRDSIFGLDVRHHHSDDVMSVNDGSNVIGVGTDTHNNDEAYDDEVLRSKLKKHIVDKVEIIRDKLQFISLKYDRVKDWFNLYSLILLVMSAVITLNDALKLLMVKYIGDNDIMSVDPEMIDFMMNIASLCMGTYMTIVASIIRFKNYREKMEKLGQMQDKFIHTRAQYNREMSILNLNKNETKSVLDDVNDRLSEYDQVINEVNILSEISNEEMLIFTKKTSNFKVELNKIKLDESKRIKEMNKHEN